MGLMDGYDRRMGWMGWVGWVDMMGGYDGWI